MRETAFDTIFALSSGAQKSGVAVVRASGPHCETLVDQLVGGPCSPRRACLRVLRAGPGAEPIDQCLVLWFPGPESFTGEDVVEFHVHGGPAVVEACLQAIGNHEGCRLAEAGEFARRAFEHQKLDLSEIEGLSDLINAQTELQRRSALREADGRVRLLYEEWREQVLSCLALVEADVDFVDEDDVPEDLAGSIKGQLSDLLRRLEAHISDPRKGEILRNGFRVVLAGLPNVGKSSLLNVLAQRDAAIVTDVAGTTRDVLEVFLDLAGMPIVVCDTAGLRPTADTVEQMGVDRAVSAVGEADLVVWICDDRLKWPEEAANAIDSEAIWIRNKADLGGPIDSDTQLGRISNVVSAQSGEGIAELLEEIKRAAIRRFETSEHLGVSRQRHAQCVKQCAHHIGLALGLIDRSVSDAELLAEELRLAARALAAIGGGIDVEDVLDRIFGEFCIGK